MKMKVPNYKKQLFEFFDEVNKIHVTKDKRQMVLLLGLYGEYLVNELLRTNFLNSKLEEIYSQDIKLRILKANGIISPDEYLVLDILKKVRNEYAHKLDIDKEKVKKWMKQTKINWKADKEKIKELEKQFNKIPFTKFQSGCIAKITFLFQKLGKGVYPKIQDQIPSK